MNLTSKWIHVATSLLTQILHFGPLIFTYSTSEEQQLLFYQSHSFIRNVRKIQLQHPEQQIECKANNWS